MLAASQTCAPETRSLRKYPTGPYKRGRSERPEPESLNDLWTGNFAPNCGMAESQRSAPISSEARLCPMCQVRRPHHRTWPLLLLAIGGRNTNKSGGCPLLIEPVLVGSAGNIAGGHPPESHHPKSYDFNMEPEGMQGISSSLGARRASPETVPSTGISPGARQVRARAAALRARRSTSSGPARGRPPGNRVGDKSGGRRGYRGPRSG